MFKLFIILIFINNVYSLKNSEQNLLEKILTETNSFIDVNKRNIFTIIDRVTHIGIKNTCDTKLIQTDVQNKMRQLKSFVSTCNGYCRIAMGQDERIYAGKDFSLETIWIRIDLADEVIINNKAYLGVYFIKFVLADRYLCTTQQGELYASKSQSKECLWSNELTKIVSVAYSFHLAIEKNCKITMLNSDELDNNQCSNRLNITSGYSPELQKFFRTCQSNLIKNSNDPLQPNSNGPFRIILHQTTKQPITKKTFNDDPKKTIQTISSDYLIFNSNNVMINRAKQLCKEYLLDEIILEKLTNYDYIYESKTLTKIPKLCIDYVQYLNQNKNGQNNQVEYNNNNNNSYSDDSDLKNSKIKKCFQYKNTPFYKQCLDNNYKCHKYINDSDKLKKCRKKYGIKLPKKKPLS
ncbi:unnamed protein product [Brachionus calyciflorus]|uniref:Uncharacterized protein n=1 Tax=Brachionus calyciflorus TaxID=104777 RepID=A0A813V4X8_9BILA|nr:unnamed protein product [Brachionus calyciflorus]